ncbi:molybdopterin-guanine dinucleotide biosynthesis protein B [Thiomonas sp.]|jgi:molybdopterin-guanine dinucleotide biosynthesis protein B|uniref:molybdopterin-guanine dinucleotide biosynthesis protein B n=1 Tax=Thiomonas sp. TaxID=2047785 RepID=UPI002638B7F0|nr:molybdopterin-guanine dinucleotide biosynthesis protein B [Thiomonas sp.]
MQVAGFVGSSGSGKTTLIEALLREFGARGLRASVIKHAHHGFELDREGKDSWRHRKAGAFEVLVASPHLLALQRETREAREYELPELLGLLREVDWVFVEGFSQAPIPRIEVWRAAHGRAPRFLGQSGLAALACHGEAPAGMPPGLPVLELGQPGRIAAWLIERRELFSYPAARP